MKPKRKITVVTSSRADFGHLHWPLHEMLQHSELETKLIVMGAHLSSEFGHTADEIERLGFRIDHQVESLLSSDSDVGMSKSIALATLGLTEILARERPDVLLVIADRYEMLAPASVALALRIPIAHIEGGEVSAGAIDDAVRNALTKLSHVHFVPTAAAQDKVISMGEEPWRVHLTGAPSLDHLRRATFPAPDELSQRLGIDVASPYCLVSIHPVTLDPEPEGDGLALLAALDQIRLNKIVCFPNADAGSRALIDRYRQYCDARDEAVLFVNLAHLDYWSLLRRCRFLIGNSSSGIMETPSLPVPAINIGRRQDGRERAANVIDCAADADSILAAVDKACSDNFVRSLQEISNPYGNGTAAEKIAAVMAGLPDRDRLLDKRQRYPHIESCSQNASA